MSFEIEIQEFMETLVSNNKTKIYLLDFFKNIHEKFFPDYDISFMQYFLELTHHRRKFVVHHKKLVEYEIMTSKQSSHVKVKLDLLRLVEDVDYRLTDVCEPVLQGGISTKKIYRRGAPSPLGDYSHQNRSKNVL
jgi:hypothetical protein